MADKGDNMPTDLEKAIQQLTDALVSQSPHPQPEIALATARGVLVILLELQKQVSS